MHVLLRAIVYCTALCRATVTRAEQHAVSGSDGGSADTCTPFMDLAFATTDTCISQACCNMHRYVIVEPRHLDGVQGSAQFPFGARNDAVLWYLAWLLHNRKEKSQQQNSR